MEEEKKIIKPPVSVQSGHTQPELTSPDCQGFKDMSLRVFRGHGKAKTVTKEGQAAEHPTVMMVHPWEREAGGCTGLNLPRRWWEGDVSERAVLIEREQRASGLNLQL